MNRIADLVRWLSVTLYELSPGVLGSCHWNIRTFLKQYTVRYAHKRKKRERVITNVRPTRRCNKAGCERTKKRQEHRGHGSLLGQMCFILRYWRVLHQRGVHLGLCLLSGALYICSERTLLGPGTPLSPRQQHLSLFL